MNNLKHYNMAKMEQINFEQEKQRDKYLLFIDLCARLPYGVEVTWDGLYPITLTPSIYAELWKEKRDQNIPKVYLRPMSSMTEEELKEYRRTFFYHERYDNEHKTGQNCSITFETYDWLNKHHFDYRGLIEKGLALVALEGMYDIK